MGILMGVSGRANLARSLQADHTLSCPTTTPLPRRANALGFAPDSSQQPIMHTSTATASSKPSHKRRKLDLASSSHANKVTTLESTPNTAPPGATPMEVDENNTILNAENRSDDAAMCAKARRSTTLAGVRCRSCRRATAALSAVAVCARCAMFLSRCTERCSTQST